jgi:trigger factor
VKVSTEQRDPREAVLTVDLDEDDVEPYLAQAYLQAVRRLNIPGFRKGKAPRRIIEQMFGREYLLNEAMDTIVQDVTSKAVEQEGLELGGIPSVSIENFNPPVIKATVPLVPAVDLADYESVRVEREEVKVNDEEVETVLSQLSRDQAVWEPVDGPVQMDDLIELTVHGWVEEDGERREIISSENTEYIPRPDTRFPVPNFDEGLVGLVQDKLTEFTVDVPDDFENKDYAGKKAVFEATVHQVKRREPPALDDEFAKGVGEGFESMQALRERVADDIRSRGERNADAVHQNAILTKIVEGASIEISPLIIDHELEHYVHDREEEFKAGRIASIEDYQQYVAWQAMTPEQVHEDARPRVEERLKRAHVLREVAKRQSFEATDEEVDAEIEAMVADAGTQADEARKLFADEERRESLRRVLVNRKTLAYLTELAGRQDGTARKKTTRKRAATPKAAAKTAKITKPRAKPRSASGSESGGS